MSVGQRFLVVRCWSLAPGVVAGETARQIVASAARVGAVLSANPGMAARLSAHSPVTVVVEEDGTVPDGLVLALVPAGLLEGLDLPVRPRPPE